jgi:predicted ATPase
VEDLQPEITSELDRKVYLMMSEDKIAGKQPGWLLSTGTLRILALLGVLRHPKPPPVIIIEEIENGLDPRTIHLLVDEIRNFIESGYGQVIATTHSPYLLDLLKLAQLVVAERDESGSPVFTRPASQKSLIDWAQKFSPGKLYTMGKLKRS